MVSLFPQLFAYQELALFILRLVVGFVAISLGYPKLFKPAERLNFTIGLAYFCAGVLLLAGLLTQFAAGLIILASLFVLFYPDGNKERNYKFFILLIAVSAALMFLGPGIFSLDLPL